MLEAPDKRRRTDLDLFVLALIESGVTTPYELQKAAGLSQGATVPALQRLMETGQVRQGKPGLRGRTDYRITAAGKKSLKSSWQILVEAGPSGELESDLRIALLAMWVGNDRRAASEFLRQSADRKRESVVVADQIGHPIGLPPLARWYRELRSVAAKAVLVAESMAIEEMADTLPRRLLAKTKSAKQATKKQEGS